MVFTLLNIVGIFRTILIIVFIYLLVRWIGKLFAPSSSTNNQRNTTNNNNGSVETTIRYNKSGKKIIDKDKGEYVDFEEVD